MFPYVLGSGGIIITAFLANLLFKRNAELNDPSVLKHRHDEAASKIAPLEEKYQKSLAKFGNANPGVLLATGLILTLFFGFAITTTFTTYSWLFLGLGWSQHSANLYALVPFTLVFAFALIVKMCLWPLVKHGLWDDPVC